MQACLTSCHIFSVMDAANVCPCQDATVANVAGRLCSFVIVSYDSCICRKDIASTSFLSVTRMRGWHVRT
jgi:hypothetical protein